MKYEVNDTFPEFVCTEDGKTICKAVDHETAASIAEKLNYYELMHSGSSDQNAI